MQEIWQTIHHPLFQLGDVSISALSILSVLFVLVIAMAFAASLEKFVIRISTQKNLDLARSNTAGKISKYVFLVIALVIVLDILGIHVSSLTALGAVLGVGLGFGLQNITQNFISGLIILFEQPVRVGDIISVGNSNGKVIEIGARSTKVLSRDERLFIIPNSDLITREVTNESFYSNQRLVSLKIVVAYGSDFPKIESLLLKIAREHARCLAHKGPKVLMSHFLDFGVELSLNLWIDDGWFSQQVSSELRFSIENSFRQHQISMPVLNRELRVTNSL